MEIAIQSYALVDNHSITIYNTLPGKDVWAIRKGDNMCLSRDGKFEYEPMPSERTEQFFKNNRFTLDEAKAMLDNEKVSEIIRSLPRD